MLVDMFYRGGLVMIPLLAVSVLGLALILDRAVMFVYWFQGFGGVIRALRPMVVGGAWEQAEHYCRRRGPFTHVALTFLQHRDQSAKVRDDVVRREGTIALSYLENRLRWLATVAQVSTLLGLLGTFYFMIYRFHPDATASGQIPQADFFAAIWESFLSTMFGLVVAIPCTAAYQIFEGRVDAVARDLGILVSYLEEWQRLADKGDALPLVHGERRVPADVTKIPVRHGEA